MDSIFTILGATFMFLSVAAGAFGAHGLKNYFTQFPELSAIYETAVRYQSLHSLGLFVVAWMCTRWPSPLTHWAGYLFVFGILLFSGSLYLLVFTRTRWLGAITPIGGLSFLAGWALLAFVAWRN